MTTIYIPNPPNLHISIADYVNENMDRNYYYCQLPYLGVAVLLGGLTGDMLSGKFDCSLGYHDADAPAGFTSAQGDRRTHSKITIRQRLNDDAPADIDWQQFLDGCPMLAESKREADYTSHKIHDFGLPDAITEALNHRLAIADITFGQYVWQLIEDDWSNGF